MESAYFYGDKFRLQLALSENTDKLYIYIDGQYIPSVSENMTNISSLTLARFADRYLDITVYAFDRRMHHATADARTYKGSPGDDVGIPYEDESNPDTTRDDEAAPPVTASPAPRNLNEIGVTINGATNSFDVPSVIVAGLTLMHVRMLAEAIGAEVVWVGAIRTAVITTK